MKLAAKLLGDYIERTGATRTSVAKKVPCSLPYLSELIKGRKDNPSIEVMAGVQAATDREVKIEYWGEEYVETKL